jgi:Family of unknown function (DUF6527)
VGIALRVIDIADKPPWGQREAGMMWRYPKADEDGREGWWIVLPMTHPDLGTPGHPSQLCWLTTERASDPPHEMWTVTGTPPLITVTPSIDVMRYVRGPDDAEGKPTWVREGSYWHGWITNGELV